MSRTLLDAHVYEQFETPLMKRSNGTIFYLIALLLTLFWRQFAVVNPIPWHNQRTAFPRISIHINELPMWREG